MCCKSKKKPLVQQQPSKIQPVSQQVTPAVVVQPVKNPSVLPLGVTNPSLATSTLSRSRIGVDKNLQKSHVRLQQVQDPSIVNFFKDCKTQRIQLTKVTNEHNSYVRQYDYFDLSSGHEAQLRNLRGLTDVKGAYYGVDEGSTLSTPSVHKFIYDRDVVDVGYTPATSVYRPQYHVPGTSTNMIGTNNINRTSGQTVTYTTNAGGDYYASGVQAQPTTTNYNTSSTVQPFAGQGQPIGAYSTVQPVGYTNSQGAYVVGEPGYREVL